MMSRVSVRGNGNEFVHLKKRHVLGQRARRRSLWALVSFLLRIAELDGAIKANPQATTTIPQAGFGDGTVDVWKT
ncbi:MAG: hypothetical protein ABIT38_14050 [Gemmatimonadaceae bacterium]